MTNPRSPLGHHLLADFHGVAPELINHPGNIARYLEEAARCIQVTVLGCHVHHFGEGGGVTGVLLLAESHMSIHTWPERGFAAVDVFTCTPQPPHEAVRYLEQVFKPARLVVQQSLRGVEQG